jgi:enterochelin esterase-like enzyme
MNSRQATNWAIVFWVVMACAACTPKTQIPSPTPNTITPTQPQTETPIQPTPNLTNTPAPTATSTPLACLSQPGRTETGEIESTKPPQAFIIYLPACYDRQPDQRYPVLYLLHGQTYTNDQWIRLGVITTLDELTASGQSQPFIIIFPDDHYWYAEESGPGFGKRLVEGLVPYIDQTYRTIPDRDHRAIGGLSRGGGWALKLGLSHWDLFSIIGLHSPAILSGDGTRIEPWITNIPPESYPRIYMDIGDNDQGRKQAVELEKTLTRYTIPHEWHLNTGGTHTEKYWQAHIAEYIAWYASQWNQP